MMSWQVTNSVRAESLEEEGSSCHRMFSLKAERFSHSRVGECWGRTRRTRAWKQGRLYPRGRIQHLSFGWCRKVAQLEGICTSSAPREDHDGSLLDAHDLTELHIISCFSAPKPQREQGCTTSMQHTTESRWYVLVEMLVYLKLHS